MSKHTGQGWSWMWGLAGLGLLAAALLAGCGTRSQSSTGAPAVSAVSPIRLRDVAAEAGLRFRWGNRGRSPLTNLETFGCGCAFWDWDNDGWQDILLVGEPRSALYRNLGNGKFRDVTAAAGLDRVRGPWKGCAVGDMDADGWSDLVLTGYHQTAVLKNVFGTRLRDVTRESGILNTGWGSSAGFSDLDNDGDLDLYICNYVLFGPSEQQYCELARGVLTGCPPSAYHPERGRLFRNDGRCRFTDVTVESGVNETSGKALVVGFCDYDADGRTDFYVGNDGVAADLLHNLGGMKFDNAALVAGTALSGELAALAAMGIDWGDVDLDGRLDAVVTAFSDQSFALFRNNGSDFTEDAAGAGIAEPTRKPLGFGCRFADFDNDGWLDLVFACGHVYDAVAKIDPASSYLQPLMIFRNQGGWKYADVTRQAGADCQRPILGRGLASADYDRDGLVDLLVVDYEGAPLLLRNETAPTNHWLEVAPGGPPGNPLGYGCRVEVTAGGRVRRFEVTPVSSYLSSSEPVVRVGLGSHSRVEQVRVTWPDGSTSSLHDVEADTRVSVPYPAKGAS